MPILTVQEGCDKLCYAFPLRGDDADKNVRTLRRVVKSIRERTRGEGVKKVTILSVRTFWMTPYKKTNMYAYKKTCM